MDTSFDAAVAYHMSHIMMSKSSRDTKLSNLLSPGEPARIPARTLMARSCRPRGRNMTTDLDNTAPAKLSEEQVQPILKAPPLAKLLRRASRDSPGQTFGGASHSRQWCE